MEKDRIKVRDLKKFLEGVSDDAEVSVDVYDSEHHKEFLVVHEYSEDGKLNEKELLIIKSKLVKL